MALNIQIQRYASTRLAKGLLGAVAVLFIFFAINIANTLAMPGSVLTRLQAGVTPSNLSPNPASVLLYNDSGQTWQGHMLNPPQSNSGVSSNHGFKHILKNEPTSNVRNTILHVYYDTQNDAQNDNFIIKQDYCNFSATNGNPPAGNNSNPYPGAGNNRHVAAFYVNGVAVVGSGGTAFRNPATPSGEATTCANFDRSWPAMGSPMFDATTGKWRNDLLFQLEGNRYGGGSQKVLFQVGSARGGTISIAASQSPTDFGIDEEPGTQNSNLSVAAGLPFGLTCAFQNPVLADARIDVYDPDPTVFGKSYLSIMKRAEPTPANPNPGWQKLVKDEYSDQTNNVSSWDWGSNRWVIDEPIPEQATSTVFIKEFKKDTDYLMVYDNPYKNGKQQPSGNVLSVGLPGESFSTTISCKYNLQPSVTQPNPDPVSSGEVLTVSGGVTNIGPAGGITGDHTWQQIVAKFRQKPDMNLTDMSGAPPCDVIPATNRYACAKFSGDYTFPAQQNTGSLSYQTDANDLPGSYICFVTRVANPTDDSADDGSWRYTDMKCSVVGKKPKVQVHGSDLKVDGLISTSLSSARASDGNTKTFGSWVEYGVFSTGTNSLTSSGAGLRDGNLSLPPASQPWSRLTFSNTALYGNYQPVLSNARALFERLSVTGPLDTSAASIAPGVYEHTGALSLGSNVSISDPGKAIIIRVNGTVTINGNIDVNNNGRGSIQELSQVVILADHISIQGNVSNIDAWLLTRNETGSINTCNDVAISAPLTVNLCNAPLTVNGAVMTSHLYLRRTGGADAANPGAAAEVFRLRPDAQLWAYGYANQGDRAQTVYVSELPPRF